MVSPGHRRVRRRVVPRAWRVAARAQSLREALREAPFPVTARRTGGAGLTSSGSRTVRDPSGGIGPLTCDQKVAPRTPGVSADRPLPTALQMRPPETPWDIASVKRREDAFPAMDRKPLTVSHLRAHATSPDPYPVLSGNYRATKARPVDS